MRWALAALSFALLVGLAVATAATRAANAQARVRLERIEFRLVTYSIERARRRHQMQGALDTAELRRRWLEWEQAAIAQ